MKRLILIPLLFATAPAGATEAELAEYGRVFADAKLASDYCPGVTFNAPFFKNGIGGADMPRAKEKLALVASITPRVKEIEGTIAHYGAEYWCITYKHLTSKKYVAPNSPTLFDGLPRQDSRRRADG